MSLNLHIPTSLDEVKGLATAAVNAATDKAKEYEHAAADLAQKGLDKASNAVAEVAKNIPTVTITKSDV
jgi:hypothetical protein